MYALPRPGSGSVWGRQGAKRTLWGPALQQGQARGIRAPGMQPAGRAAAPSGLTRDSTSFRLRASSTVPSGSLTRLVANKTFISCKEVTSVPLWFLRNSVLHVSGQEPHHPRVALETRPQVSPPRSVPPGITLGRRRNSMFREEDTKAYVTFRVRPRSSSNPRV